jgi:hypothetical protein
MTDTPEHPACAVCKQPVADEDYGEHYKLCREERARAGREMVLAKVRELFPREYAQAEEEVRVERAKKTKVYTRAERSCRNAGHCIYTLGATKCSVCGRERT